MSLLVHIISIVLYAVFLYNTTADFYCFMSLFWYNQTTFHKEVTSCEN